MDEALHIKGLNDPNPALPRVLLTATSLTAITSVPIMLHRTLTDVRVEPLTQISEKLGLASSETLRRAAAWID